MRIAVCGTKGGSGKSTLAGLLALCFADAGKGVLAVDADPQATLTTWMRSVGGIQTTINCGQDEIFPAGTRLGAEVKDGTHIRIIDFPPASPDALLKIMKGAMGTRGEMSDWFDVLLVPCRPALADIWSIRSFLEKLDGYKGKVRLVMNALDNSSISKAGSIDTLLKGIKTPRTKATLSRRACYSYAMAGGWPALDEKAKSEVLSLALELSK
jgi:cellulose biosynthesis protein BcsQ